MGFHIQAETRGNSTRPRRLPCAYDPPVVVTIKCQSTPSSKGKTAPVKHQNSKVTHHYDPREQQCRIFKYGPFGELIRATGSKKDDFNFRFSTKYEDAETDLYYYGFRYYDAETGRWPSRDPIGEKVFFDRMVERRHVFDGLNLETAGLHPNYSFLLNDPINEKDVLGLDRYITQFDICNLGGSGGTQLHVGAAVDWWKEVNGKWVKGGTVTYDFSVDWEKNDGSGDTDWWNILKGAFWVGRGRIVESQGLRLDSPQTMTSSPCQDNKMRTMVEADIANPPQYNSLTINCLGWAVGAVNYGIDEPEPGECCNCDGSIWTASE